MKKHAPIKQLKEAGEEARKKLVARGVLSADNLVSMTAKKHPDLILPGMPSYIPHKWTIKSAQRIMYDIFKMWQFKNKVALDSPEYQDSIKKTDHLSSFIEFCIKEMNYQEEIAKKKMDTQGSMIKHMKRVPVLGNIFKPVNEHETIKAVKKFFVDSFAVSIIVKGEATTTGEFADFFFTWTDKLYTIWERQDDKNKTKVSKNRNQ